MNPNSRDIDPAPKVTLKPRDGQPWTLALDVPESMAARYDVWMAAAGNFQRAAAAALGLCAIKAAGKARYRGDVNAFGGEVIDHLVGKGIPYTSIASAGAVAFNLVTEGLGELTAEIDAAEGNSEAPPAISTE